MSLSDQIEQYLASVPEPKQTDLRALYALVSELLPGGQRWFFDGLDASGKVVSNPNIGFGAYQKAYADGTVKPFYQIGISANATGLSVYVMGIDDRRYLPGKYSGTIGKANVTGYCVKFRALKDVHIDVLTNLLRDGLAHSSRCS
ncbi:hypothetical protein C7S18_06395 [Ahniella affigens]|uniref:YdhG-like domain-containing protein n=1 Tax=Ahniella affigens TaxID=2021234 RepID=A0A2P1PPT9_9GAMM|nr:hypothetical protein [Ahniella affigens]AVP96853.1 hypothetical protein C7S18_06395 [Ahniella affigens]